MRVPSSHVRNLCVVGVLIAAATLATTAQADRWKSHNNTTIEGSGDVVRQVRDLDTFDAIRLEGIAEIHINIGTEETVEVEAEDNIIDLVETRVRRGRLTVSIEDDHEIETDKGIHIWITMKSLEDIELAGVGSVEAEGLDEDKLFLDLRGVGNMKLKGRVDRLEATLSGVGNLELRDLLAQDARLRHSGVGSADVRAENELDIRVSGIGSVRYHGKPRHLTKREDGLGTIAAAQR